MIKTSLKKIVLYMIGGIIATAIDMFFLYVFTDLVGINYLLSQVFSFCISLLFGFAFQKYITFQKKTGSGSKQLLFFFVFQLVGLCINLIVLKISVELFAIHYMIAALLSKGIVFCRNFVMNNYFNFKD
ncbi:MAG: GtrA family protein [Candidatus Absconditabacteria bacterium]